MRLPDLAPGTVEQATYTWTRQTITGQPGEGFEVVSPGLRASIPWLQSLDTSMFRILADDVRHESEAYAAWREFTAVCTACVGPLNVVYRKIASAGTDAVRRNRSLVHILVGAAAELNLATVSDSDPRWLTAHDSPPDRPPQLESFAAAELTTRSAAHECDELDEHAAELLEQLVTTPGGLRMSGCRVRPDRFVTALLVAVPSPLWRSLEVNWFVGVEGPVVEARVRDAPDRTGGHQDTGMTSCRLHGDVERTWAGLSPQRRTWAGFGRAQLTRGPVVVHDGSAGVPPDAPPSGAPDGALTQRRWLDEIAGELGVQRWDASRTLAERDAVAFLGALEQRMVAGGAWDDLLSIREWHALLGDVESLAGFRRVRRFFGAVGASTRQLAALWRATGLAPVGFALLCAEPVDHPERRWALPKAVDEAEIEKLVAIVARTDDAELRLARLVAGGMGYTPGARRRLMSALAAADVPPRVVFERILLQADLPPGTLLAFVREHLDTFVAWLKLPQEYHEVLARGLRKRSFRYPLRRAEDES